MYAQGHEERDAPLLPKHIVRSHILPHLGLATLALAACVDPSWRSMASKELRKRLAVIRKHIPPHLTDVTLTA